MKAAKFILFCLILQSCFNGLHQHSMRSPALVEKPDTQTVRVSKFDTSSPKSKPAIYIKKKALAIKSVDIQSELTGSLFKPEEEKNFLYTSIKSMQVGRFIDVKIANAEFDSKINKKEIEKKADLPEENPDNDELLTELLKIFPSLTPPKDEKKKLLTTLRMAIIHRDSNGDVIVRYERSSASEKDMRQIEVKAKIPYEILRERENILSSDLVDVEFRENSHDKSIERFSTGWEDEYTLRISGFSEAKSEESLRLDQMRADLKKLGEKLKERIIALNKEKQNLAKERDQLINDKKKDQQNLEDLKKTVDEQKQTISEQNEKIAKLEKPEDKPGDERDGARGE